MKAVVWGALLGATAGLVVAALRRPSVVAPPGPQPQQPQCPSQGTRLLFIGDSFAEGLGPPISQLAAACSVPIHVDDRRGSHAWQWAQPSWIEPAVAAASGANVALVSLGGNDFKNSHASVQTAVNTIVTRLRAAGMRVIWISPLDLPYSDDAGARGIWKNAVGDDWFQSQGIVVERAPDGVHTSAVGYAQWASMIWPWLSARL